MSFRQKHTVERQKHTVEPLSVSIIIEWENVRLSKLGRSKTMLRQLSAQIHQLMDITNSTASSPEQTFLSRFCEVEVIVLYNDQEIDESVVTKIIVTGGCTRTDRRSLETRGPNATGSRQTDRGDVA